MTKKDRDFKYDPRSGVRIRERPRLSISFDPAEHMTVQDQKDVCDINKIMARYKKTGLVLQSTRPPMYGDFTSVPDYVDAMQTVRTAQEMFMALPSDLRKKFENDPAKFIAYMEDPANREESIKLGLRNPPKPAPEPVQVRVIPEPDAGSETPS